MVIIVMVGIMVSDNISSDLLALQQNHKLQNLYFWSSFSEKIIKIK
jgi:hypothetical protein